MLPAPGFYCGSRVRAAACIGPWCSWPDRLRVFFVSLRRVVRLSAVAGEVRGSSFPVSASWAEQQCMETLRYGHATSFSRLEQPAGLDDQERRSWRQRNESRTRKPPVKTIVPLYRGVNRRSVICA